jgi:hypothetical protein
MDVRKKAAMFRRWFRILFGISATAVVQGVGRCYARDAIRGYYNDFTGKVGAGTLLDDSGIPLTEIAGGERVHFPIAIFQYGLGCWDEYLLTKNEKRKDAFLNIARWALEHQLPGGAWDAFAPVRSAKYGVSSMCQGEGASLLIRAYVETQNEEYRAAALRAIDFMLAPTSAGGTAVYDGEDLYLEEYPQSPRRSVLNGWIFSIFGLYDAALVCPDRYRAPLERTIDTLIRTLPRYDCGYWSRYDLLGKFASPAYHRLHIALIRVLDDLSPRRELYEFAERLERYQKARPNYVRAVAVKLWQKCTESSDVIYVQ